MKIWLKALFDIQSLQLVFLLCLWRKKWIFRNLYVDYWSLNEVTIKIQYLLLLITSRPTRSIKNIYQDWFKIIQFGMKKRRWWMKDCFLDNVCHFESNIMLLGLTNTQAIFQHLMTDVFGEFLDIFCCVLFRQNFDILKKTKK